ncbi:MAG: hypothetical protein K2J85_05445 [Anaeroplasmataceae bacterium]|nr:hypothetical protein [Anaeroplasmataceae bacterium]
MGTKEVEFFHKQIESNLTKASQGGVVLTSFLDETKQAYLQSFHSKDVEIIVDGGFDEAEYKRAIFKPLDLDIKNFKIKVYEILYNSRYLELNHRKVLGSLLGLGIKRESIGDIAFLNQSVYFACTEEIAAYIVSEFKTIHGVSIELKEVKERLSIKKLLREEKHIVSSLRLDVIVASAYKFSRNEAATMITEGLVQLNHIPCLSISKQVSENDVISVRHKGRIYVGKINGKTKSDRLVLQLGFLI